MASLLALRSPMGAALLLGAVFQGALSLVIVTNTTQTQAPVDIQAWYPWVNNTAVVRPFYLGELMPLAQVEHEALGCERHACPADTTFQLPIDLVLYYAGFPTDGVMGGTAQTVLEKLAQTLASRGCFRAVRVAYANIPKSITWPEGPCKQFMSMVGTSPQPFWGYRAVYQMELDVLPVRDGWLLGLLPHLAKAAKNEAWVIGGHYTPGCMVNRNTGEYLQQVLGKNMATHINGNAVYSSDPIFANWAYAHAVNCHANGHYDSWLYAFAVKQNVGHMWRAVPEILNCKPNVVARVHYHTMEAHAIADRYPSSLLVHSTLEPTGVCP